MTTSNGYWRSCALHAGVKLDIFSTLGQEQFSAQEIAKRTDSSERGTVLLLNGLTSMGLLIHKDDNYANTEFSRKMLCTDSPAYIGFILRHHSHLVDGWAQLDRAVTTGQPVEKRSHGEEAERESFLMGMFNISSTIAPVIAEKIDLSGRSRLLDLGGGPGTHAIHFCLQNPALRAVIFDRDSTEPFARKTVTDFALSNRIDFMPGDFNHDSLGGPYDAAWLSQILHSNSPEECKSLINRTVAALDSKGLILIHDFLLNDTMDGPEFPALFSLNMLINNHGRNYSEKEVHAMLSDAGCEDIKRLDFQGPNSSGIMCGTKI